jgi:hypothetical protein
MGFKSGRPMKTRASSGVQSMSILIFMAATGSFARDRQINRI